MKILEDNEGRYILRPKDNDGTGQAKQLSTSSAPALNTKYVTFSYGKTAWQETYQAQMIMTDWRYYYDEKSYDLEKRRERELKDERKRKKEMEKERRRKEGGKNAGCAVM